MAYFITTLLIDRELQLKHIHIEKLQQSWMACSTLFIV